MLPMHFTNLSYILLPWQFNIKEILISLTFKSATYQKAMKLLMMPKLKLRIISLRLVSECSCCYIMYVTNYVQDRYLEVVCVDILRTYVANL